jgi:hypothetical protein
VALLHVKLLEKGLPHSKCSINSKFFYCFRINSYNCNLYITIVCVCVCVYLFRGLNPGPYTCQENALHCLTHLKYFKRFYNTPLNSYFLIFRFFCYKQCNVICILESFCKYTQMVIILV